jgi:uncharacterized membrane protein YgdD (TMEM256/DUF423 family)
MNLWAATGAMLMAAGVGLGAFGAHALRERFDAYQMDLWQKAVFYHLIHAVGMLAVVALAKMGACSLGSASRTCVLLAAGIVLFSGSLYTLALTYARVWGAVTPFGGVAFLGAWLSLAYALWRGSS